MSESGAIGRARVPREIGSFAESKSIYKYRPLDQGEIRLIKIDGGRDVYDPVITCNIIHVCLGAEVLPKYTAVSYCWETDILDHKLNVASPDGLVIPITHALHTALIRLRAVQSEEVNDYVWADVVCIDQSNVRERNDQILLMQKIYNHAFHVAIFLGEEMENSEIFREVMEKVQSWMRDSSNGKGNELPSWGKGQVSNYTRNCNVESAVSGGLDLNMLECIESILGQRSHEFWKAAQAFLRRSWFSRLWVVQEAMSARMSWIYCGWWVTRWDHFQLFFALSLDASFAYHEEEDPKILLKTLLGLRQYRSITILDSKVYHGHDSLLNLLMRFRDSKTSLPVDHLYAVLGLSKERCELTLKPDYADSLPAVIKRYIRFFLDTDQIGDLFRQIDSRTWMDGLPSWFPNWIASDADLPWIPAHDLDLHSNGGFSYNAGGTSGKGKYRFNPALTILIFPSIFFDKVCIVYSEDRFYPRHNFELVKRKGEAMKQAATRMANMKAVIPVWVTQNLNDSIEGVLMAGQKPVVEAEREMYDHIWQGLCKSMGSRSESKAGKSYSEAETNEIYNRIIFRVAQITSSLQICWTAKGRVAQVPCGTQVGDSIVLLQGHATPFVVRNVQPSPELARVMSIMRFGRKAARVVGACYVHEVMDGNWWDNHTSEIEQMAFL